ncbi:MAG: spore maturation protein [Brevinema sp.]
MIEIISKISSYIVPILIAFITAYAYFIKKVPVFEVFIDGAKEGVHIAVKLIPFLVGFLTVIGMLRHSGAIQLFTSWLSPIFLPLGIPPEVLPLGLLRPVSSAAATGILAELFQTHGPDSFIGMMASIITNSTDTTLYILAVYFGSVGVKRYRHALAAGLLADFAGVTASIIISHIIFGYLAQ